MSDKDYEIKETAGSFAVYRKGRRVTGFYRNRDNGASPAAGVERGRSPGKTSRRLCICCGVPFRSQGPHNRLCTQCKSADGAAPS